MVNLRKMKFSLDKSNELLYNVEKIRIFTNSPFSRFPHASVWGCRKRKKHVEKLEVSMVYYIIQGWDINLWRRGSKTCGCRYSLLIPQSTLRARLRKEAQRFSGGSISPLQSWQFLLNLKVLVWILAFGRGVRQSNGVFTC